MSSADATKLLRRAITGKQPITFANDGTPCDSLANATHIVISSHSFPKAIPTRFRKADVSVPSAPSDYYTLEALYLVWHLKDASAGEYSKQARENGLAFSSMVGVTARKNVVEVLEGKIPDGDLVAPLPESLTPTGSPTRKSNALDTSSSPSKRRYVPDTYDIEIVKKIKQNEIDLRDRNAVLQGAKPNNFSSIKAVYTEKLKRLRESSRAGAPASTSAPAPDMKMQSRKARNTFPIIMVSSSPTALITMHNVKRFLQDAVFETSQEARERGAAEKLVTVDRKVTHIDSSGKEVTMQSRYIVVDSHESLNRFGPDAWERVVCVMTTGQAWQFKPYRWSEPRVLFHHVKGIYFSWASDPPNSKIKDWNVSELKIDQNRRHVDKAVVASFWMLLDTWMLGNKPSLLAK